MTGWRLGAAIGPAEIIEVIAKLNVNDESCTNHFVQYGALEGLTGDQSGAAPHRRGPAGAPRRRRRPAERDARRALLPRRTHLLPVPRTSPGAMGRKGLTDVEELPARGCCSETGVSVCSRVHFGRAPPGEREPYVRLAYSGIDTPQIVEGLERLRAYLGELKGRGRSHDDGDRSSRRGGDRRRAQRTRSSSATVAAGGRMVDFAGWEMPLQYPGGIVAEHLATRRHAGLFDVSHMGRFIVARRRRAALPAARPDQQRRRARGLPGAVHDHRRRGAAARSTTPTCTASSTTSTCSSSTPPTASRTGSTSRRRRRASPTSSCATRPARSP